MSAERPSESARVEVLTAAVRVLMVGNRQVTLSVFRQLDEVAPDAITPFGRVRDSQGEGLQVVGADAEGNLVWSGIRRGVGRERSLRSAGRLEQAELEQFLTAWRQLPLIVLAGLR